jgi:hypothetical protein
MKRFPKFSVLPAIVFVFFNTQISNAQSTSSQSEFQAAIRVVQNGASTPTFEVELSNIGDHDLVLNLGMMLANGRQQYAEAIHLVLKDAQKGIEMLDLKGPPMVAALLNLLVNSSLGFCELPLLVTKRGFATADLTFLFRELRFVLPACGFDQRRGERLGQLDLLVAMRTGDDGFDHCEFLSGVVLI